MSFTHQQKRSTVPGRQPTSGDLLPGQLGINLTDRKLFTKDENNTVIQLGVVSSDLSTVAFSGNFNDLLNIPPGYYEYVLPPAAVETLGGIMVGLGLTVDGDGKVDAAIHSVKGEFGPVKTGNVIVTRSDLGLDILDANGKIKTDILPDSVLGRQVYKGAWNADVNSPAIPPASEDNAGWHYAVAVAGDTEIDGISEWYAGDSIISNGTIWERIPGVASTVMSVNGQTGNVSINAGNLPGLATVAGTGSYTDLDNVPSSFPPAAHTQSADTITGLANVAKTGSYNDLNDLPPDTTVYELAGNFVGNPTVLLPVNYLFSRPVRFEQHFAGSYAWVELQSGTSAQARIMRTRAGTKEQVGSLTVTLAGVSTFTSIYPTTDFLAGDRLTYEWISSGISNIAITLKGKKQ